MWVFALVGLVFVGLEAFHTASAVADLQRALYIKVQSYAVASLQRAIVHSILATALFTIPGMFLWPVLRLGLFILLVTVLIVGVAALLGANPLVHRMLSLH